MWFWLILGSASLWALIEVYASALVHRYRLSSFSFLWIQSCTSVLLLLTLAAFLPLRIAHIPVIVVFALSGYLGDLFFYRLLKHLDISIVNAGWALLALLLSAVGFLFFGESWSFPETAGAVLILSGVLMLSFFHAHVSFVRTMGSLVCMALLYAPLYVVRKWALMQGVPVPALYFWLFIGRDVPAFICPLLLPSKRRFLASELSPFLSICFFLLNAFPVLVCYVAEYFTIRAYATGPISLISVTANAQPFLVIALAWVFIRSFPHLVPKELLTWQSVSIKVVSFSIVFLGLALLASSQ